MHDDVTLPLGDKPDDDQTWAGEPRAAAAVRDTWGSFRLQARVGHGGFGEVYRAWDPNLEREVALKLLLPSGAGAAQSDEEYKSMLREARALASVRHPNIVSVYGIDRHDGRVGFWMDFVKGRTLSAVLGAQGPFGYREAALIALDVTRALSAVHRAGLLHRDIKAENVMREEGGRILLMDLGLSSVQHTETNSSGTPSYMAPELWEGKPATVETDIYAMGVLLYYLVSGEHPVRLGGKTAKEASEALGRRKPLMDVRSDLPESYLRMVSVAIEIDPVKRFSSAGELAAALSDCLGTTPVDTEAGVAASTKKKDWRLGWPVRIGGVALVVALLGLTSPTVRQWLHLGHGPEAVGVSTSTYDEYLKAQELLKKSYKDSNVTQAISGLQQVLKEDSTFALAEAALGNAYYLQYRNNSDAKVLTLAKQTVQDALKKDQNLAPAYATLAQIEADSGNTQLAMQQAQKAISLDPRSAEAYAAQAEVYQSLGRPDDAVATIQKAIDLEPDNSIWQTRLGGYYLSQGNRKSGREDAAAAFQKAVDLDPQNLTALYDLGVVDLRIGKLDDARANFQKVLSLEPDEDSYRALGTVFLFEGKYSDAIEMEKKAVGLNPQDRQAWGNLGSAYTLSADQEKATESYRKAIDIAEGERKAAPNDPELLIDLADYYASIHDPAHSTQLIRKALALSPKGPKIAYFAGESYELLGQRAEAIPLIARALAQGYPSDFFQRSPEMASLRNDPAFQAALTQAKKENAVDTKK